MTTTATPDLRAIIEGEHASLTAIRRDIHAHPELGYEERRTCGVIERELKALGVAHKAGYAGGTGVVAHITATADNPGPCVAFRADIDALPIHETTGVEYSSTNDGVMHACGHDGHTAILIGLARTLVALDHRPNPVTLIFQPAEEGGGGGARMCDDGALEGDGGGGVGPKVTKVFGLHNWPGMPLGTIATKAGPLLAATDEFNVTIKGTQGHAAFPHMTADPVTAVCHTVGALQTIASRNAPPTDPMVLSVTQVHSGFTHNVIPSEAMLGGTLRTVTDETRKMARERFYEIVRTQASSFGCEAEIDWHEGYPVTHNNAALADHVLETARTTPGVTEVQRLTEPFLGGEDFAYYGAHVPACFFVLGACSEGETSPALLHQPHFDFNDAAIPLGIEMFARLALA
jgi:amidohydrolase